MKELQKMLHKCNEQLQQFSHVNKKALDQYMNFTEQREQLQNRRAELDAGDQVLFLDGLHHVLTYKMISFVSMSFKDLTTFYCCRKLKNSFQFWIRGRMNLLSVHLKV